jgi:hypothetical protein
MEILLKKNIRILFFDSKVNKPLAKSIFDKVLL